MRLLDVVVIALPLVGFVWVIRHPRFRALLEGEWDPIHSRAFLVVLLAIVITGWTLVLLFGIP